MGNKPQKKWWELLSWFEQNEEAKKWGRTADTADTFTINNAHKNKSKNDADKKKSKST